VLQKPLINLELALDIPKTLLSVFGTRVRRLSYVSGRQQLDNACTSPRDNIFPGSGLAIIVWVRRI